MKSIRILAVLAVLGLLTACAAPDVQLDQAFWQNHQQKVDVAHTKAPKAALYQQGQQGLLDVVVSDVVTHKFNDYLKTVDTKEIASLSPQFAKALKARGIKTEVSTQPLNLRRLPRSGKSSKQFAHKNFTVLAGELNADKILLVDIKQLGATRSYYGPIPLGAPKAICKLEGQLVDLKTNKVLWRYTSDVTVPVSGKWDQAPHYPNFNTAIHKAMRIAKQELFDSFTANV